MLDHSNQQDVPLMLNGNEDAHEDEDVHEDEMSAPLLQAHN